MKEERDSLSVPYNFARCFNDQCPQASKCLRHIAAQYNGADYLYITSVNPTRYPADGNQCECFKTAAKVHVTWGLKRLLDRIPYEDAVSIRSQLVGHYGKTGYYRLYRGERGLMPKDQAYIKQLFRSKRIRDAAFFLIIMLVTFAATLLKPQNYVSSRTIQKCVEHVSTST